VCSLPGGRAASASDDRTLGVWHVKSRTCIARLEGHLSSVRAVAGLPDGRVVSGGADATVCVWDVPTAAVQRTMEGHEGPVSALVPMGAHRVVSASEDGTLRVWDCDNGRCERVLREHVGPVAALVALGETRLASGGADGAPRIWVDAAGGGAWALERSLAAGGGAVTALAALSAERLAAASADGVVRLFRVLDGSCAALFAAGVSGATVAGGAGLSLVPALASLRDGRLATASGACVAVWRELAAEDGPQTQLRGHARGVTCLAVVAAPAAAAEAAKTRGLCGFDRIC
jgi:WD40 repeat protein